MLDIKYNGNETYRITFKTQDSTLGDCANIIKCKQRFLDMMSWWFDRAINDKLGDCGFIKESEENM